MCSRNLTEIGAALRGVGLSRGVALRRRAGDPPKGMSKPDDAAAGPGRAASAEDLSEGKSADAASPCKGDEVGAQRGD